MAIHTYVTTKLAATVGKIAEEYQADDTASILIKYRDEDPEQHWHVIVDRFGSEVDHLVDDQTGEVLSKVVKA